MIYTICVHLARTLHSIADLDVSIYMYLQAVAILSIVESCPILCIHESHCHELVMATPYLYSMINHTTAHSL